jgi:hypothetical protein
MMVGLAISCKIGTTVLMKEKVREPKAVEDKRRDDKENRGI